MTRRVNVFLDGEKVGCLDRVMDKDLVKYRFAYLPDLHENKMVSLIMPVRNEPYIVKDMPASFDMIIPEGERRDTIAKLSKLGHITDLDVLAIVGSNTIGRVQFSEGETLEEATTFDHNAIALCENGKRLFNRLLEQSGFKSGVAGVQPKILARELDLDDDNFQSRTLVSSTDIIKSASEEYEHLVLNEYCCLEAARLSGMEVPAYDLSLDGTLLAVKRFDLQEDGIHHLGFEEICALQNKPSTHKYFGAYDIIIDEIDDNVFGKQAKDDLKAFFKQLAFMVLTRNGDGHLKNFGLLYNNESARLAPAYDLITTTVYQPDDYPALNLSQANYSKRWWTKEELIAFGQQYCGLKQKQMNGIFNDIEQGMHQAATTMADLVAKFPSFADVATKMTTIWSDALTEYNLNPIIELDNAHHIGHP